MKPSNVLNQRTTKKNWPKFSKLHRLYVPHSVVMTSCLHECYVTCYRAAAFKDFLDPFHLKLLKYQHNSVFI